MKNAAKVGKNIHIPTQNGGNIGGIMGLYDARITGAGVILLPSSQNIPVLH